MDNDIPPDTEEIIDLQYGHKAKIERTRPENSAKHLAMLLVEALDAERVARMEEHSYKANAMAERQKVQQFKEVIFNLKERRKNPPQKISRMDPYNTYDLGMCEEEMKQAIDRMQEFDRIAGQHTEAIKAAKIEQRRIQQKLRELNSGDKR